jgi:hypothetical protein
MSPPLAPEGILGAVALGLLCVGGSAMARFVRRGPIARLLLNLATLAVAWMASPILQVVLAPLSIDVPGWVVGVVAVVAAAIIFVHEIEPLRQRPGPVP